MQGIYEGLAQQPASPPGVVQSSKGPALTPEWAAHISPQYVPVLPTCSDLIYLLVYCVCCRIWPTFKYMPPR